MTAGVPGGPPQAGEQRGRWGGTLRLRIWLYLAVILAIVAIRLGPGLRSRLAPRQAAQPNASVLILAGLDLAPILIPRIVSEYRGLHPEIDLRLLPGGSRKAMEDLLNHRANLAFLNRLPTPEERRVIATVVDSLESYSIALGGISVLAARGEGPDSLTLDDLRAWLRDDSHPARSRPPKLYAPDPNLGLWASLTSQLGLPESADAGVTWLADERQVAKAVAADPNSLGFASTMALPPAELAREGARIIPLRGGTGTKAVLPGAAEIADGEYPLFHYLYLSCFPNIDAVAAGFVTFMYGGRGQRLVEREGYLPARQTARIVQLVPTPRG